MSLATRVVVLVTVFSTAGCDSGRPATPTSPEPSAQPPPSTNVVPDPPRTAMVFDVRGVGTDAFGMPVPGARVSIWIDYSEVPSVLTDPSGRYQLDFTGSPGENHYPGLDPVGTRDAVAFVTVQAPGYEFYARYLLGTSEKLVEDIQIHRIQRITAGASSTLTLSGNDSVCVLDAWAGRELVCRTVRVEAPRNGVMTVEAVPVQAGQELPLINVWATNQGAPRGNPARIAVVAGTEYFIAIDLPWGLLGNPSFVVTTSIK